MRAIRVHEYGEPEVLQLEDIPPPEPGAGEVLVRNEVAGVNFADIYERRGVHRTPLPFTIGEEGAGTVAAVGQGVTEVKVGDRVAYGSVIGGYAEYCVVPLGRLVPVPPALDSTTATALMLQGLTAHYLTSSTYPLQAGDTCLVHAAASGVGGLVVQMAKRRGARVIATVSTADKAKQARDLGADEMILYTQQDFEAEVQRLTGGAGVQVVYDGVGRSTFEKGLRCLGPRGYLVLYGQASGPPGPLDPHVLRARGLFLTRPSLPNYILTRTELLWRAGEVMGWAASGQLKVSIGSRLPLDQAAEAHRRHESREAVGKTILVI